MESIGVRELRQNISKYLHRVEAGESILVTDHGVPIAVMSPPRAELPVRERLRLNGELLPAERRRDVLLEPALESDHEISAALERLREDEK